jgi:outer membrane protein OmpA-like peptidoglycan-associated protein
VSGNWGPPVNIGKSINSEDHDIYPFVYNDRLFYSSKGLNGYGGYDIYTAKINPKTGLASQPQNMGKPINSFSDDIAFITYSDEQYGYFSSNRGNETGSDHLYYFHSLDNGYLPEFKKPAAVATLPAHDTIKIAEQKKNVTPPPVSKNPVLPPMPPITNTGAEKEEFDAVLMKTTFNHVQFGFNDATLGKEMQFILDSVAAVIRAGSQIRVELSAYTDSRGAAEYNKKLSQQRAEAAREYLLHKGVPSSKIVAHGYGETHLLNGCSDGVSCTPEQHQLNRRVELKLMR